MPNAELYVTRRDSTQLGIFIAGQESGYRKLVHEDREMFIFTQPLGDRPFVLTAICPAEDVYGRYSRMQWFLWFRGVTGVLILLFVLYAVVGRHLRPLHWLADSAQSIANGNLDTPIPDTHHEHEAGRLQNSFISMQQSLATSVNDIRSVNAELEQRNEELTRAYQLQFETNREKAAFIQKMYHEIRTPLNIIGGFTQVLTASLPDLPAEEVADITGRISESATDIARLAKDLDRVANSN